MKYRITEDIKSIREILGLSQSELANQIGVEQVTISRNELGKTNPSDIFLEKLYAFAFDKNIKINKLKEMLWRDDLSQNEKLLFHGAKSEIVGDIDIHKGRKNNDFGQGFYTGESYEQAISFVSGFNHSSVYYLRFDDSNLKCKRYKVDQEWMMTIAYYRGALDEYKNHPSIKSLIEKSKDCDYIIAPIADNRMFQIINSFIDGELTDEQCKHCLAATNLGMQYIFVSEKAVSQAKIIERCYISANEREYYKNVRFEESKLGDDKVKLARKQYRGQGKYIDEILV
jgi:transcriptional regulator with XRE-family HTH domain